jgi:predicted Ser/Thr protein kinase
VAPHAIDTAALWAVLTRMRRCDASLYNKDVAEIIEALSPFEKLRLYDTGETPEHLSSREAKDLRHHIVEMYQESLGYPNYEGRFGASAREIRTALLNAAHHTEFSCLHPLAVLAELREILSSRGIYDFLKQEVVSSYHDHKAFLAQTEGFYAEWIDHEIRESMGLASERSYSELFERYVFHVSHWVKREKIRNPQTGDFRDPDESLMKDVERVLLAEGEKPQDFRKSLISTIGARALEHPELKPNYSETFKSYITKLRDDFFSSRRKIIARLNQNFLRFTGGEDSMLDPKEIEQAKAMLNTLEQRYGYCQQCARDTVVYLLKKKYVEI